MNVREFVIRLALDAVGFRQGVEAAQRALRELLRAGGGLDDLGRRASGAGDDMRDAGQQGRRAGEAAAEGARQGESAWKSFGDSLGRVAAVFGGGALIAGGLADYRDTVGDIAKTSEYLGMSMAEWQGWRHAAQAAGTDAENLATRLADLGDYMQDLVLHDSGPLKDAVKDMGVSFKDGKGNVVSLEEGLLRLAEATEGMDRQKATSLLTQIGFDEQTIPVIIKGRKGLEELTRAGRENARYTKQDAEIAAKMREAWLGVQNAWRDVTATVMRAIGPVFGWLAQKLEKISDWTRDNGDSVLVYVTALAAVFATVLAPAVWSVMAPLLPLMLLFGGLAVAIDELIVFAEGGESALEKLMRKMGASEETIESVRAAVRSVIGFFRDLWTVITGDGADRSAALDRVREKLETLKTWFRDFFAAIGRWIGGLFDKLGKWLLEKIPEPVRKLMGIGDAGDDEDADAARDAGAAATASTAQAFVAPPAVRPEHLGPAGPRVVDNSRRTATTVTTGDIIVQAPDADPDAVARAVPNALREQVAQADGAFAGT